MEYARLGHSGIEVSKVCIGGMSFGKVFPDFHQWVIGPSETREVLARALEQGVNFIDTANTYAHGTSEEYIGQALKDLGIRREDVVACAAGAVEHNIFINTAPKPTGVPEVAALLGQMYDSY